MPRRNLPPSPPSDVSENVVPPTVPRLDAHAPDRGRVHPYGDRMSESAREEPNVDAAVWVCSSCGYQWERRTMPAQCPNCATSDEFVRSG